MKAERLARILLKTLPGRQDRARQRLAGLCRRAADRAVDARDERLEVVAAVGEAALGRAQGIQAGEFLLLAHVAGQ